ncbi:translation elongation factor 4 [Phycisphaera mikurensis]|uniref:Elongation factor 4 n=1 Tax=Phycisphaera mikurensis (strain NBRC 102666 / KCTC 22515 / FYK2301M01) TaxID=1142394 RepID=I0IH03_PHYMF|nr:translation elongation factor 4 [Phycisphaera mikurensis]MBB6440797.1 GTP-binding protein LepA [Phycisphaera mikurensis]BAM04541.1 GTP-binding protein LepA [Phycisphaera mikurensis NBRC 102666]
MPVANPYIRNFCIIAHIDHGKSTLADRMLQGTGAMDDRTAQDQKLDSMDIERERGITIKAAAVSVEHTWNGQTYELNFIDTPGHVDFHYEVSRALAACEGACLIVDATQGVEAQTVANLYKAVDADLELIPVINKIDLPSAEPERRAMQVEDVLGLPAEDCILTSAKSGQGVAELLDAICERFPPPEGEIEAPLQALIFDAKYDDYRGVIVYFRVMNGRLKKGDRILFMGKKRTHQVTELGKFKPDMEPNADPFEAGDVGYMIAGIKTLEDVNIGDTITLDNHRAATALPGYEEPQPMVYCDFYPSGDTMFDDLREAIGKLKVNDASFTYEPSSSEALGSGFRCGFLGMLHMDIIQERLEREGHVSLVQTAPTVTYEVQLTANKDGVQEVIQITNPAELPDMSRVKSIREPMVAAEVITPTTSIGDIMKLCENRRGVYRGQRFLSEDRQILEYELPLAEIIYDFFDKLKSITSGYGTVDYRVTGFQAGELVKMDILVNGSPVEALSLIVHRSKAESRGRHLLKKLKEQIDRHLFEIPLQAAIGGKIIGRETIKSVGKNVTAKCYGGDVSRKRKLLEKQKKGKDRMKRIGTVDIPQGAFMAVLDTGE